MHAFLIEGKKEEKIEEVARDLTLKEGVKNFWKFSLKKIEDVKEIQKIAKLSFSQKTAIFIKNLEKSSQEAKSALLKTLEEPPKNLVFIIGTKDVSTIPETIISRCIKIKSLTREKLPPKVIKEIENFLNLKQERRIKYVERFKEREKALDFLEKLIFYLEECLPKKEKDIPLRFMEETQKIYKRIKENANPIIQLTFLAIFD